MTNVNELIKKMTLEEKAALCTGAISMDDHAGRAARDTGIVLFGWSAWCAKSGRRKRLHHRHHTRHLLPDCLVHSLQLGCGPDPRHGAGAGGGVHRVEG